VRKSTQEDLPKEETSNVTLGFRAVYVFDQADTDGKPLAELASAEGDPSGYTERLRQFVTERDVQLEYSDSIYPAQGQCTAEKITLLHNSLAHEVAHSLLHFTERRGETTKRVRETEAEAVAFVICEAIGLKAQNSADYIQLYSGDKETLVSSLECIQRTSTEILAAIVPSE